MRDVTSSTIQSQRNSSMRRCVSMRIFALRMRAASQEVALTAVLLGRCKSTGRTYLKVLSNCEAPRSANRTGRIRNNGFPLGPALGLGGIVLSCRVQERFQLYDWAGRPGKGRGLRRNPSIRELTGGSCCQHRTANRRDAVSPNKQEGQDKDYRQGNHRHSPAAKKRP